MNQKYPYNIDFPQYIPSSQNDAKVAFEYLESRKEDIGSVTLDEFVKGWFAIAFLNNAPHPDDLDNWPESMAIYAKEAFRRYEANLIHEDQLYASDASLQGLRLEHDSSLNSYVVMTFGDVTGYLSANFSPEKGNQPCLTGNKSNAYIYDSPADAHKNASQTSNDGFTVCAGHPDKDLNCPIIHTISMQNNDDKEVIIQREDGLYLYRDGVTWGDSTLKACKYLLKADRVEEQIQQVKEQFGATWKWLDYQEILDCLD